MSLVEVLKGSDFKAQREAVWAITNITSGGSTEQIIELIEKYPVIQPFCDLLASKDTRTLTVILSGLTALFKTAESIKGVENLCELLEQIGGLDRLEALQNHENEEIYEKAYLLIDTYFTDAVSFIISINDSFFIKFFLISRSTRQKTWHQQKIMDPMLSILKIRTEVSTFNWQHFYHSPILNSLWTSTSIIMKFGHNLRPQIPYQPQ